MYRLGVGGQEGGRDPTGPLHVNPSTSISGEYEKVMAGEVPLSHCLQAVSSGSVRQQTGCDCNALNQQAASSWCHWLAKLPGVCKECGHGGKGCRRALGEAIVQRWPA